MGEPLTHLVDLVVSGSPIPSWRAIASVLRWGAGLSLAACWYVPLVALSHVVPMARLNRAARLAFRLTLRVLGMRLVVRGLEHLDPARGYLYLGNHVNALDPFVFVAAVPQMVVALEKRPNFRVPLYGRLIRRWGNIPIDRDDLDAALAALDEVARRLRRGESICVMPEGTRTRTGEMGAYLAGPFRVAVEAEASVVPFALRGLHRFNRTGSLLLRPGVVEVIFTPPIEAAGYGKADLQALAERARAQTLAALALGASPDGV